MENKDLDFGTAILEMDLQEYETLAGLMQKVPKDLINEREKKLIVKALAIGLEKAMGFLRANGEDAIANNLGEAKDAIIDAFEKPVA